MSDRTPQQPRLCRSSMTQRLRGFTALLACAAALSCHARPAPTLDDPALAARIDGAPVHALTLRALLHQAKDQPSRPSADAVLAAIVADRLQATWARARFGSAELTPASTVGFAADVAVDDKLVGLLRSMYAKELEAALRTLPGGTLSGTIVATFPLAPASMERLFGQPRLLRLGYSFDAAQSALASQTPLLRYRLAGAPAATLTLHDVYLRQNVQGRMDFFAGNLDFIAQQARLRAAMRLYGLADGAEAQSKVQATLARQVTAAEIGAFYTAHREQFRRIEKVRARHIRVGSEALATQVLAQAAGGKDFGLLARRYSVAPDAGRGGELGWVRQTDDPDWLASLVLLQPEARVSGPFRSAVGPGEAATWDILLVDQRVEGYHPPDSETVRYLARKAIAHERARAQFLGAREQLVGAAAIGINRTLLDEQARGAAGAP